MALRWRSIRIGMMRCGTYLTAVINSTRRNRRSVGYDTDGPATYHRWCGSSAASVGAESGLGKDSVVFSVAAAWERRNLSSLFAWRPVT